MDFGNLNNLGERKVAGEEKLAWRKQSSPRRRKRSRSRQGRDRPHSAVPTASQGTTMADSAVPQATELSSAVSLPGSASTHRAHCSGRGVEAAGLLREGRSVRECPGGYLP